MDTSDDIEMNPDESPPEKDNATSEVEKVPNAFEGGAEDPAATEKEVNTLLILTPTKDGYWCNCEVDYSWSTDGKQFTCYSVRYNASRNDRWKGNLYLDFGSGSISWGYRELTNDDGHQDEEWRDLRDGGTIAANSSQAWIRVDYTYDRAGAEVYMSATSTVAYTPPPPDIGLIKNIASSPYAVAGRGVSGCQVRIVLGNTNTTLGSANVLSGAWSTQISYPANVNKSSIQAFQSINGQESARTAVMEIYRASLTFPQPNTLQPPKGLIFRGIGAPRSTVLVVKSPPNHGEVLSAQTSIDDEGNWNAPLTASLPSGSVSASALVSYAGTTSIYTLPVPFRIRTPVVITSPDANSIQSRSFMVSGTGGEVGATMKIYIDLEDMVVGTLQSVTGNAWSVLVSIPASIPPGDVRLAAEQTLGVPFDRSEYQLFKIKPDKVTALAAVVDDNAKVTITGTGTVGANLDIYYEGDQTPVKSFIVASNPWSMDYPDWLPSATQYSIRARQHVLGADGQPIYSDVTDTAATFTVVVPVPTLTHRVSPESIPTFSGVGRNWPDQPASRVEVRLDNTNDPIVPIVNVLTNGAWSSTASARWAPGTFQVTARQLFQALTSTRVVPPVTVVIPSPPADIDKVVENGVFPQVEGRCWPGAVVTITFSDTTDEHPVPDTDADGNWSFQRPAAFRPGRHTVTVTQTFGGQTSNPVSRVFEIALSVPVITPPPDGQTDHLPVLQGKGGIDGCVIQMLDFVTREVLGEALATGDNWMVALKERDYLNHTVFARQIMGDLQSPDSASVTFKVVLLAPKIDFPETGTTVPRTFMVEGYARPGKGFDRTEVELYVGDAVQPRIYPQMGDGYFKHFLTLPLGPCELKAKQFFKDQVSPFTGVVEIMVVPDKALIETPGVGEAVGRSLFVCGFGYPRDKVVVALAEATDTPLGTAVVQEDWTWFCKIELPERVGALSIVTEQRNGDFFSGWSSARIVELLDVDPSILVPSEGTWETSTPGFAGEATGARVDVITWYDSDESLAENLEVSEGRWAGKSEQVFSAGPHWVRAVQIADGKRSMPADSNRFEVASPDESPPRHPRRQ